MAGLKLVNKLKRREKNVQTSLRGRKYEKMDKRSSTLADSPGAAKAQRHSQRRLDRSFGQDFCAHEPQLSSLQVLCDSLERVDFGSSDFGLMLTLAPSSGGQIAERTRITTRADVQAVTPSNEITEITCVGDIGGSLNNSYFLFDTPNNSYYFWMSNGGAGTDPMVADRTGIEVSFTEDDSADSIASAVAMAMDNQADISGAAVGAVVTAGNDDDGACDDAADGGVPTGFSFDTTQQGADEVLEDSLNDKYFLISSPDTDYYVWFNVAAAGTDPMIADRTGIEVALSGDESAEDVAAALASALDAEDDFEASDDADQVEVMNAAAGAAPDAEDGDSEFLFSVTAQGADQNSLGVIAGDVVQIQNGSIAGRYLKVEEIINGTQLRLEDQEDFDEDDDGQEDDVWVQFQLSSVKPSHV